MAESLAVEPIVETRSLTRHFPVRRGVWGRPTAHVRAVEDVSLQILPGETLGVVGESGCGKTTLGRLILRLLDATSGEVYFRGRNLGELEARQMRSVRRRMQIVFQDPYSSLNPRMRVGTLIGEGLKVHGMARGRQVADRVEELLAMVGLSASAAERFPT